jgi:hypothetical protein
MTFPQRSPFRKLGSDTWKLTSFEKGAVKRR